MKILNKIKHILKSSESTQIKTKFVDKHVVNLAFPFLISFPRTGSHWLRMLMELYFEKPSLVRAFYYPKAKNFTCYHTHDLDLMVERKNVLYLYRNPVDTIYSQLNYHNQSLNNELFIKYWASIYGLHLSKWIINENFTEKKTIITYEGMKVDLENEFSKVCEFFNETFEIEKFKVVKDQVSKEKLKQKTKHDAQVVNLSEEYQNDRNLFKNKYSKLINEVIHFQDETLLKYL